ncbi:PREDICTED: protein MIS12 homolog [Dufourea novaeangliae]|uniref:Protein MIS12 homolog n=1 Tax=Dufourea novaeangliae TaxID=178035 RepID=A0A154P6R0_DUFNO|nr:PREDICTED: protein MIS12 homolog [Dufourea novaeangliae]KZC07625.1 hypothetical protein WN55_08397 [Dufourea novaeangliae]
MASTELRKRKREEYEMQLFGFHSRAVYATMQTLISERICGTAAKLCNTIKEKYKLDSGNVTMLKSNQRQLEKAYCKAALSHLRIIQNIVNKYIAVPSNVLLEEDKYQRTQYTDTEFQNIKQRLEDLQQRAKRATILNASLKEELQILEEFPVTEDRVNILHKSIENGLKCTDINKQMYKLVEDYKQFSTNLFGAITISEKLKYNTVNNLKCKEIDLNSL